ncbi:M6 family metalloprotease domain-containing protein [Candidatus Magnetobacterium bavaricum]|uniref:M6 family metalloprotease domain-containing protein n=1 Tax=Candidatus Magnetobacterium bavaricum TaxID=29290 RepID=A0A0F3GMY3_9BACT|nr:M6 family metalloprotease domain-containing protein [Candidatus Magnetobacterium bavaricum]
MLECDISQSKTEYFFKEEFMRAFFNTGKRPFGILLATVLLVLCFSSYSFAVPANDAIIYEKQSDGSIIKVHIRGDEWLNWVETTEGYTVARGGNGDWYYVIDYDANNQPVVSSIRAQEPPSGLIKKNIIPLRHADKSPVKRNKKEMFAGPKGKFNGKVLFILAEFTDREHVFEASAFANILASKISGYYYRASHGKVSLSPAEETSGIPNDGVVGWIKLDYRHPNIGDNIDWEARGIAYWAMAGASDYVNFASFDTNNDGYLDSNELAIVVIVAGYEKSTSINTPTVWAHVGAMENSTAIGGVYIGDPNSGNGNGYAMVGEIHTSSTTNGMVEHMATMGVIAHELGHLIFGFPDLYDTQKPPTYAGLGPWCLMASGTWGKASTDAYDGTTPVFPCAFIRSKAQWIDGYTARGQSSQFIAVGAPGDVKDTIFKAKTSHSNEYFLVENRQPLGYDKGLEKWIGTNVGGLAIYHVDEGVANNNNPSHRMVKIIAPHGQDNAGYETFLWNKNQTSSTGMFNNWSKPNSDLYNGKRGNVSIASISASDKIMTANTVSSVISGTVTDGSTGTGMSGVEISLFNLKSGETKVLQEKVKTDAYGKYSFSGLTSGTYIVVPPTNSSLFGISGIFVPSTANVTIDTSNVTVKNFIKRFKDNGDGSITDTVTKLQWMKEGEAACGAIRWAEAFKCAEGLGNGWRMPTLNELYSLCNTEGSTAGLDAFLSSGSNSTYCNGSSVDNLKLLLNLEGFNMQTGPYWSATTTPNSNNGSVWLVNMGDGYITNGGKLAGHYVWPVR